MHIFFTYTGILCTGWINLIPSPHKMTVCVYMCNQLYLQVQGVLEFQTEKLLLMQLDEILTVCKALRHLWEDTEHMKQ